MRYQKYINTLEESDKYSTRTIEIIHGTMYHALSMAVRPLKKISSNPCDGVVLPKKDRNKSKQSLEYINSEYINKFLKIARQDNYIYYIFFKTLIETGMRKGEAAALQRKDIDLKNRTITNK